VEILISLWEGHKCEEFQQGSMVWYNFSKHEIEEVVLVDLEPIKLQPTWRNNISGEARVSKTLD
jgi:hypothetical protein